MIGPRPWRYDAPLQPGTTLLEASAGTGKTYQITNLVVRLLTEPEDPVRMGQLLVVTFTRAATGELVDRIRARLGRALAVFHACLGAPDIETALVGKRADESLRDMALRAAAAGTLRRAVDRLERALGEFDQALISTIHGFCQRMLQQNAFETLVDFGLELVEDDQALVDEIVDDFTSARVNAQSPPRHAFLIDVCGFSRDALGALARRALQDPTWSVDPDPRQPPPRRDVRLAAFADWWERAGLAELAAAMDEAVRTGGIVPAWDGRRKERRRSQSTYVSATCLERGRDLLAWARARSRVLAGVSEEDRQEAPGVEPSDAGAPDVEYWSERSLRDYSPTGATWYHPHLGRVREALDPNTVDAAHERALFADFVRAEFERRMRARRSLCFQDLLRLLARRLEEEGPGGPLRAAVGARFRAALIDEFQDTDPQQWSIFQALFGDGRHHLVLIGDPKQAIYGFRGANVHVYLAARQAAGERVYSLDTNYRSDAVLLGALNPLLAAPLPPDPARAAEGMFSQSGIAYETVGADVARTPAVRLRADPARPVPADHLAPLRLRYLDARSEPACEDPSEPLGRMRLHALLPGRIAADIVRLLDLGLQVAGGEPGVWRPLSPGDVAVLVRRGKEARAVHAALLEAGVPCVLPGADSVLRSDEARDVQLWLRAVLAPGSDSAARAAATTPLFGRKAADLFALDDPAAPPERTGWWDRWLHSLSRWQALLGRHGVLRAFREAMRSEGVQANLLCWPDGERRLTNLLHVLELLHAAEVHEHLQPGGLIRWIGRARREARADAEDGELRLERDDAAVRILTMHKAKGLQFPVVFAPFLWRPATLHPGDRAALVVASEGDPTQRILDLHGDGGVEPKRSRLRRAEREVAQEALRLLYVALTRAELHCVVYTAHVRDLALSPLGALLHAFPPGTPPGSIGDRLEAAAARVPALDSAALMADLCAWAALAGAEGGVPRIAVQRCEPLTTPPRWSPRVAGEGERLGVRAFTRLGPDGEPAGLDHVWARQSYTSLHRARRRADEEPAESGALSEREAEGKDDDQDVDRDALQDVGPALVPDVARAGAGAAGQAPDLAAVLRAALPKGSVAEAPVPFAAFPAGAEAGTFLHELFEQLDFTAFAGEDGAARGELSRVLGDLAPRHGFDDPRWRDLLFSCVPAMLRTPLGGELGELTLADLPAARRLNELTFDLPLAGGDLHRQPDAAGRVAFAERVSGERFGAAFRLAKGDPVLRDAYLDQVAAGWCGQRFAGYLNGSIDLVFATPVDGPPTRFYVLDYKSNRLDLLSERAHPRAHFCPAWMRHEMERHDYVVQYHLYTLALHRHLEKRLAGYDYDRHMGGAIYLFVRGLCGPERPDGSEHPYGVFFHRPRRGVIEALDALFSGGVPEDRP